MLPIVVGEGQNKTLRPFLTKHVTTASDVFVRSSNFRRTQLSAQALLSTLLEGVPQQFAVPVNCHDRALCNLAGTWSEGGGGSC